MSMSSQPQRSETALTGNESSPCSVLESQQTQPWLDSLPLTRGTTYPSTLTLKMPSSYSTNSDLLAQDLGLSRFYELHEAMLGYCLARHPVIHGLTTYLSSLRMGSTEIEQISSNSTSYTLRIQSSLRYCGTPGQEHWFDTGILYSLKCPTHDIPLGGSNG